MSSVLGIGSLERLKIELEAREKVAKIYKAELEGIADISFMQETPNTKQTYYIFPIFTKYNRALNKKLLSEGIESNARYFSPPIHKMLSFKEYHSMKLPVTDKKANSVLALPIHGRMNEEEGLEVCKTIKSFLKDKQL